MAALPDTDVIIFYDIPSTVPGKAWSPNTWKTRFALNIKGIPYRTEWVEYPDIAPLVKSFGLPPNSNSPIPYTLPTIYDPRTKRAIMDSAKIAKYLDDEYPDTPAVLPKEVRAYQATFDHVFWEFAGTAFLPLLVYRQYELLQPASQPYWRLTREAWLGGVKLEDISPPEKLAARLAEAERAYGLVGSWLDSAGDGRITFLGGEPVVNGKPRVTHADINVATVLLWMRTTFGADSAEWKTVEGWHGGRWKKLLDLLEPFRDASR